MSSRDNTANQRTKSLAKAISWRLLSSSVTWLTTWSITSNSYYAMSISLFEIFSKIGLFYCHERCWDKRIDLKVRWQVAKQAIGKYFSFKVARKFPMM